MHRTAALAAALAVAVLPFAPVRAEAPPPPVDETVAKRDATAAGKAWLALVETLAMTLDDGKWRASGYFVKPPE
jgi:hypothetical protein